MKATSRSFTRARLSTPPPIGAHRLLGSGRSIALLLPEGEVDWWCAPEPDDPPLLWSVTVGGCIESTPAVWNGRIYIGTRAGRIHAVGDG